MSLFGEERKKKYIPAMHKPHIPYVSGISASLCGGKFIEPHHALTSVLSAFPDTGTPGWNIDRDTMGTLARRALLITFAAH